MAQVVFFTRGGNTQRVADAIAEGAGVQAAQVSPDAQPAVTDLLFVGGSLYAGKIDGLLKTYLEHLSPECVGKVAVFSTAFGNASALEEIRGILEPKGIAVHPEAFHCKGSFLFFNRGRPNGEDLRAASDFARRVCEQQ